MVRTCPQCGGASFEEDPARADVVCTTCGEVLEESGIVSEVQFTERAGGHDIIGTLYSLDWWKFIYEHILLKVRMFLETELCHPGCPASQD